MQVGKLTIIKNKSNQSPKAVEFQVSSNGSPGADYQTKIIKFTKKIIY